MIGGGPAGLMAAQTMAEGGLRVTVFERLPSPGRKLLMAGRGGLNLTHSEPADRFPARYRAAAPWVARLLEAFPPQAAIAWCEGLGQPTFVGSSGRVFPKAMKASPLLRAWLLRLDALGVTIATRKQWTGWAEDAVRETTLSFADGSRFKADATVLALGGASWPRLGSDGGWTGLLQGIAIAPLRPANCGFRVDWSDVFRRRFAGTPLKTIALSFAGETVPGEAMITSQGIEGGAIYALSAPLREAIAREGSATLHIDLRPDIGAAMLAERLDGPRGSLSLSTFLRKRAGLAPVAVGLVQEALHSGAHGDVTQPLGRLVKALPLTLVAPFAIERAISSAGGIKLDELDEHLMLRRRPGVFAAGEMLDWEAPTGGYLLQACLASGVVAGQGVTAWLRQTAS